MGDGVIIVKVKATNSKIMSQQDTTDKNAPVDDKEEIVYSVRAKLWRFDNSSNEWKERGVGEARILHHKETGWYRIVMRRDKTLKVCANFVLHPAITLSANAGSDRSWVWSCKDFSGEAITDEVFAMRYQTPDIAKEFRSTFEEYQHRMAGAMAEVTPVESPREVEEVKEGGVQEGEEKGEEETEETQPTEPEAEEEQEEEEKEEADVGDAAEAAGEVPTESTDKDAAE